MSRHLWRLLVRFRCFHGMRMSRHECWSTPGAPKDAGGCVVTAPRTLTFVQASSAAQHAAVSGTALGGDITQLLAAGRTILPACVRQFQSLATAAAEPEPVPHASWEESDLGPEELTPRQVVEMLDRYIVGQSAAKRAVANALRNRWRRHKVPSPLRVRGMRACIRPWPALEPPVARSGGVLWE